MRARVFAATLVLATPLSAQSSDDVLSDVVQSHILPGYEQLAADAEVLRDTAQEDCSRNSEQLNAAYNGAFDKWISVSHLRFGPSEVEDRAFSLAFWPDTKGFTPKTLSRLIADQDSAVENPEAFAETSVAGRGFFALEFMLYDLDMADAGTPEYRCALIQAIATDINRNAEAIEADWQSYASILTTPGENQRYRTQAEALQEVFKAFSTGLEFTADTRLGRPLGTFDRPRPQRAEARRSERSLRHVELSLIALQDLGARLSEGHPDIANELDAAFDRALARARTLDDPSLAGVADPQKRFRIEALQQSINDIGDIASMQLGPSLGISAGFNSLDGD